MFSLLLIHLMACAFMTGVIWIVQLIHYPAFEHISSERFNQFHKAHTNALGYIAGPAMVVELASGVLLFDSARPLTYLNLTLIVALWGLTFLVAVPLHNKLAKGFDGVIIKKLISSNWYRTVIWTARCLLICALF